MNIFHLIVPHLPVQVERKSYSTIGAQGLVIAGQQWAPEIVLDCCEIAEAAGVVPGMSLARSHMCCPKADFIPANHSIYQDVQQRILATLYQFTDRVETAGLGSFYLEVEQLRRRFSGDYELAQAIIDALHESTHLDVCGGLADARFTAEQAALAARLNHAVVTHKGRSFLSSLPLTALPAEEEVIRRLSLLRVHTLGELAALPRSALIRQFGSRAGFLHDLASGADTRPVAIDAPPLELRHEITFEPPTVVRQVLFAAAQRMTHATADTLDRRGYQAQGIRIEITDISDIPHTTTSSVEPPTSDKDRLLRYVQAMIGRIQLERPVENLRVVIYPLRPTYLGFAQLTLFSADQDERWRILQEALRRLRQRFGEFIVMVASLIHPPKPYPIRVNTNSKSVPISFIWESRTYRIQRIYEHWRVRRFWWACSVLRDYYRLEDHNEQMRLLYRDLITDAWWLDRRRM